MPIYEYKCGKCNTNIERNVLISNRDNIINCTACDIPRQRVKFYPSKFVDIHRIGKSKIVSDGLNSILKSVKDDNTNSTIKLR